MDLIERTYVERTPASGAHHHRAEKVMPAGETRAAGFHRPYPLLIISGDGPKVTDADGHVYWDLSGNYTSLVHGHAFPPVVEAATNAIRTGTAWPACNVGQMTLAEQLVDRVGSVESVRFTNSGTEAALLALNAARVITGRPKMLMARFGYHGSHEAFEAGAFDGLFHIPAPGVTYTAAYNDPTQWEQILAEHGDEIAAVFLEPVMGAAGIVSATEEFMARVAAATRAAGALLVIDEVIAFRLGTGGRQASYPWPTGQGPDLTMFGKLIGGGFPVGAVGGSSEAMSVLDPRNLRMFHSGTFNGNPVTMAAGSVAVEHLTGELIDTMAERARRLESKLMDSASSHGLTLSVRRAGSLLNVYFSESPPPATLLREDEEEMSAFHIAAMNRGLYFASRGMLVLSTVMTDDDLDDMAERFDAAFGDVAAHMATKAKK